MSKHTPGPWKVCGYNRAILQDKVSMDGCSLTIAELPICMGPQHPNGYNSADATLIAAAPDGLGAAKDAVSALMGTEDLETLMRAKWLAIDRLEAFIAKAEGKPE